MKKFFAVLCGSICLFLISCNNNSNNSSNENNALPPIPAISYTVVGTTPHDTSYFTEGLEFYKGSLLESTGLNEKSKLVQYDVETGKVARQITLDSKYFGEGISVLRDTLYQLTYREGVVHVYDANTFRKIKELPYKNGEGWGLTHDGTYLIGTNNGDVLYYYDPATFNIVKKTEVTENDLPAVNLNELEYVNGYIYANQWQYPYILKIDPATGKVVGKMDFSKLIQLEKSTNSVAQEFNGIAYNPATKKFYVTGKNWSKIYQIQFAF